MTVLDPMPHHEFSQTELARLRALRPLADEIAEEVFDFIERERAIIKTQISRRISFVLIGTTATALWKDAPAPRREISR